MPEHDDARGRCEDRRGGHAWPARRHVHRPPSNGRGRSDPEQPLPRRVFYGERHGFPSERRTACEAWHRDRVHARGGADDHRITRLLCGSCAYRAPGGGKQAHDKQNARGTGHIRTVPATGCGAARPVVPSPGCWAAGDAWARGWSWRSSASPARRRHRHPVESLPASASARFDGPLGGELGSSVAAAGDFNGDGIDDVVLGAPEPDRQGPGQAFVVFGRRGLGAVDLGRLGALGVRIVGEDPEDGRAGTSVAGAGDVNGDGLDDVVVTDPRAPGVVRGRGRVRQQRRRSRVRRVRPPIGRHRDGSRASARAGSRSRDWRTVRSGRGRRQRRRVRRRDRGGGRPVRRRGVCRVRGAPPAVVRRGAPRRAGVRGPRRSR